MKISFLLLQMYIVVGINLFGLLLAILGQFTVVVSFIISILFCYYGHKVKNESMSKNDADKGGMILLGINTALLIAAPLAQFWVVFSTVLGLWQYLCLRKIASTVYSE